MAHAGRRERLAIAGQAIRGGGVGEGRVGDAGDPPVTELEEVIDGEPGAGLVVDVDARCRGARQVALDDDREAVGDEVGELGIVEEGSRDDDAVRPARANEVAVGRLAGRQRLDEDAEAGRPGGGREAAQGLGQEGVTGDLLGGLAEDQGEGLAAAAGQAAGRMVGVVAELPGRLEDPPAGRLGNGLAAVVEDERDGRPGDAGARGHVSAGGTTATLRQWGLPRRCGPRLAPALLDSR